MRGVSEGDGVVAEEKCFFHVIFNNDLTMIIAKSLLKVLVKLAMIVQPSYDHRTIIVIFGAHYDCSCNACTMLVYSSFNLKCATRFVSFSFSKFVFTFFHAIFRSPFFAERQEDVEERIGLYFISAESDFTMGMCAQILSSTSS